MIMSIPQIISSLFCYIGEKSYSNASSVIQHFTKSNQKMEIGFENQEKIDANWVFILDSNINESKKIKIINDLMSFN